MTKAKAEKVVEVYKETYRRGATMLKGDLETNVRNSSEIHVINKGKMSDGSEFITVKIFV